MTIDLIKMTANVAAAAITKRLQDDEPSTDSHLDLLTEHFGFNPRVFVDALVYAANEHLYSIGGQFEAFVKKQLKTSVKKALKREKEAKNDSNKCNKESSRNNSTLAKMTATQIDAAAERGVHGVLTLMENALDHVFDLLELYCLKTVFGIKPSQAQAITLKHHRDLDLRTAEERVADGDSLSAQEECIELERREAEMQQKLEKARKTRHALRIANLIADQNLARTNKVANTFAFMIDDSGIASDSSTPQLAKKLRYDAQGLMDALDHLSSTNPLGPSLINADKANAMNEREKKAVMDASGASEKDKKAWERGREAYINWEMDRIIKSVQTRGNETSDQTIASFLFASPSKETSIYSTSGPKRRRTTYTSGVQNQTEAGDDTRIGEVEDVEVSSAEMCDLFFLSILTSFFHFFTGKRTLQIYSQSRRMYLSITYPNVLLHGWFENQCCTIVLFSALPIYPRLFGESESRNSCNLSHEGSLSNASRVRPINVRTRLLALNCQFSIAGSLLAFGFALAVSISKSVSFSSSIATSR